jgi:hypothetical protein
MKYYSYEMIQLTANFKHLKCSEGIVEQVYDSLRLKWSEV